MTMMMNNPTLWQETNDKRQGVKTDGWRQNILQQLLQQGSVQGFMQSGMGRLQEMMRRQGGLDDAQAARMGMSQEAQLAQSAGRQTAMAGGLADLFGQAGQQERANMGLAMQGLGDVDANYWRNRADKTARRGQLMGMLGGAINSGSTIVAGS
jgi:hypothetical protein